MIRPVNRTAPAEAVPLDSVGDRAAGAGEPMTTSSTGRSVRTLAIASTSGSRPLSGTSALAVVTTRPGTRATAGSGEKRSVSAPIGITSMPAGRDAEVRR